MLTQKSPQGRHSCCSWPLLRVERWNSSLALHLALTYLAQPPYLGGAYIFLRGPRKSASSQKPAATSFPLSLARTLPLVVGMPFRSLKSPSVSVAPYSLTVTAGHYLILMGLTACSPFVVPWFRALPPWNDYSIAQEGLNVNTFFQKIRWKFLPAPGRFITLNRGSAPHLRGALSTMRYFTSL